MKEVNFERRRFDGVSEDGARSPLFLLPDSNHKLTIRSRLVFLQPRTLCATS